MEAEPIFHIVHPRNAQYRTDIPAQYYITSASSGQIGNIRLLTSNNKMQKFKALLSLAKSSADDPLFADKNAEELLFDVHSSWKGGLHQWRDADGKLLAVEDKDESHSTIDGQLPMKQEICDALLAVWILRFWHDRAESRHAKRECKSIFLLCLTYS